MKKSRYNTVSFLVYGDRAIFTDPITKTGGERHTYSVPTYEALRGVMESIYWKPTIRWVIDKVRVMTPIAKETTSLRLPKYTSDKVDRSYNTYLTGVAYQVEAHFEWSNIPGYEEDQNENKHLAVAQRSIARGGRFDIFLGGRECQAYVEPCVFGEGTGAYDYTPTVTFGLMFHGYTYPNMCGESKLYARFWDAEMVNGVINFPAPEECRIVRYIRDMEPHQFFSLNKCREEEILPEISVPEGIPAPAILEKVYPIQPSGDKRTWAAKLCETYDNLIAADEAGEGEPTGILYPGHITKASQFELTLDGDGNLVPDSVRLVPDDEARTIVPCSVTSQFRTISKIPHLLFDFLEYLAGDYSKYVMDSGSSHRKYMDQLKQWCSSEAAHPLAEIIYAYLSKGTLMEDLNAAGVLPIRRPKEGEMPISKWPKNAGSGMVRFKIQIEGLEPEIWNNRSLWESVCEFNRLQMAKEDLDVCYVTGEMAMPAPLHPYVRGTTKLISSNDKTDFTYRHGVRDLPQDYLQISYEASQKMHLALRWLLSHQSFSIGAQTYLLWSTHNMEIPKMMLPGPSVPANSSALDVTGKEFAKTVRSFAHGFIQDIPQNDEVVLMSLATPTTGRISVTQYETLSTSGFMENLRSWYESTAAFLPVKGGMEYRAPTPYEVADVACGTTQVPAERERVIQHVLGTMILGQPLPRDLVRSMISFTIQQCTIGIASANYNPANFKPLNITTGIVRKYLNDLANVGNTIYQEVWDISLNKDSTDRSYQLGRLLAYYYRAENMAQYVSGNGFRTTNAERLMNQYQDRPASVLRILNNRLIPYRNRLQKVTSGRFFLHEMDSFISSIPLDMVTDASLEEGFVLGYHHQLNEFRKIFTKKKEENYGNPEE